MTEGLLDGEQVALLREARQQLIEEAALRVAKILRDHGALTDENFALYLPRLVGVIDEVEERVIRRALGRLH